MLNKMAVTIQVVNYLKELFKIQSAINMQEEIDKQSVALYGMKHAI